MFVRALVFSILAFPLFGYSANDSAHIVIIPLAGFSDATVTSAIGGNPGTTLGAQRLNTFQKAADILETFLEIKINIEVDASFSSLNCNSESATLGSAGAKTVAQNTANAPLADTWYPIALANNLASYDYFESSEITANFNADLDNNNECLQGKNWYYGYDDPKTQTNYVNDISFLSVVIHELLHGLGVSSLVSSEGALGYGYMDAYSANLYDQEVGKSWSAMNDSERQASITNTDNLVWTGPNVNTSAAALALTDGMNTDKVEMYAPGTYQSGSSVSHFSTSATPNELMEPSYNEFLTTPGMATQLLQDLGWAIVGVNSPPILAPIGQLASVKNNDKVVTLSATDADGDTLTFSATSDNASVTASISGTTLTLKPNEDYFGDAEITVIAHDGNGTENATDTEIVSYTVSSENHLPVFTSSASGSTHYGNNLNVTLTATDFETSNDKITFALQNVESSQVTASLSGAILTLAPVDNYTGDTTLILRATDSNSGTADQSYVLTISNTAPVLADIGALASDEDNTVEVTLSATDADGDTPTFSATSDNASVTASISGTTLTLSPDANYFGSAKITVIAHDGTGTENATDSEIVTYTVSSDNDLPTFTSSASASIQYGNNLEVTLTATDVETSNDNITFAVQSSDSSQVTASLSGAILTLAPVNSYIGDTFLKLTATDTHGGTTEQTYKLTISNTAPIFTSSEQLTTLYSNSFAHSLTASDANSDELTFDLVSFNSAQVIASLTGSTLTLQAADDFTGNTFIEVSVYDGRKLVSQTIILSIYDDFSLVSSNGTLSQGDSLGISNSSFEFSLGGGDNNYSVDVVFDGQDLSHELLTLSAGRYFLAMPDSGAFAGDYTIMISDSKGETANFTIQRPLKVTTNINQLISNSVTQEMYIEGAPTGSVLDLYINDGTGLVDLKIDNAIITQVEAPDNANSFNRAVVQLDVNDASTASIINISADSAVLPEGDVSLTTLPFHDLALTITDLSGIGIGTSINIDDDRFVVWGLNRQRFTEDSGALVLALPTDQATSIFFNAENYQTRTVEIGAQLSQLTLELELLEDPMTVSGSITTSTLNFVSENPIVQLIAIDGSVMLAELSGLSSGSVSYSITIDKLAFDADKLTITVGDIIQEIRLIDNQSDSTINIDINAPEEPLIETSSAGGNSYLLILSLLLLVNYRKRRTRKNIE
jgi:hypothetical protein